MSIKTVLFKMMEYTPILGIIPGAIRLSAVKKNNSKAQRIAASCLNVRAGYSRPKEITRGILSCVPILNLVLIPLDCAGAFKVHVKRTDNAAKGKAKTKVSKPVPLSPSKKVVKQQLLLLSAQYKSAAINKGLAEIREDLGQGKASEYSFENKLKSEMGEEDFHEHKNSILKALHSINKFAIQTYGPHDKSFEEDDSSHFMMGTFEAALNSVLNDGEPLSANQVFNLIECKGSYEKNGAALYLKNFFNVAVDVFLSDLEPHRDQSFVTTW